MKILHTADWHLGHRLFEYSQFEEQSMFLDWLKELIVKKNIEVLLVAGDVFDTNTPSTCLLYTSPSPRDKRQSRMPSSA